MSSLFSVSLNVVGDSIDFDACAAATGLSPTETWTASTPMAGVPRMSWSVGFKKRPFESMDEAVSSVLALVHGTETRLISFVSAHHLRLSMTCNITIIEARPLYDLSTDTMAKLAALKADFLLDIFDQSAA